MAHDQADILRQLVRQDADAHAVQGAGVPLVVISGGKGGVGTTTVAANIAVALERQGHRTVLVNADLDRGGSLHVGEHGERGSVMEVLAGRCSIREALQPGPSGIQVLSGAWASDASAVFSATAQQRLISELKNLTPTVDVAVIDAGSSRSPFVRCFWQSAASVLVVTTTDATAIMECYAAIKVLLAGDHSISIQTIVNHTSNSATAEDVQTRIAAACRQFLGLEVSAAAAVPTCDASPTNEPILMFGPRSEAARAVEHLADALWGQFQSHKARSGFDRRPIARSA